MDYTIIQKIAKGVLNSSACCDGQLFTGTVSNSNPLQIQLGEDSGDIVLDGDDIILTQSVVSKKVYIKKHTHKIGSDVANHTHNATLTVAGTCSTGSITGTATGTTNPTTDFNTINCCPFDTLVIITLSPFSRPLFKVIIVLSSS